MQQEFFAKFLKISDIRTIIFLAVLAGLFYVIHVLYRKKKMSFSKVVLIGTFLGLLLGLAIQMVAGFPKDPAEVVWIQEVSNWYQLFGSGFLHLIRMIVVPLVLVSICHVIIHLQQGKMMGKLVKYTIIVTLLMVALASVVGIVVGLIFQVGVGADTVTEASAEAKEISSVATTLLNLVPDNIVSAMVDSNILGVVIFAGIFGTAVWWINQEDKELAKPLYNGIDAFHKAMVNMADLILDYMPWAVICMLSNTIANRGLSSIIDVGKFIIAIYVAAAVQFILHLIILVLNGCNPVCYLKKASSTMLLAFTSRSSVGCLSSTIGTLTDEMGVDKSTATFVSSFGTTAGMQGCAGIFPSLLIVYVCHLTGTPFDFTMAVMTVIVVSIGSLGIAGIPGTATMAASVSLSGMGMGAKFPLISPILAIDPIIDMPRTMLNVCGSMINAVIVDKKLGTFDSQKYHDMTEK